MSTATCFVVQGYGKKPDYTNGRLLDLDASYEVIKEAVEAAGIKCIRADEVIHSGTIDVPMYEYLLSADVVIADLSTYNVNAAFELGVRYALKPFTTIVIAEDQFKNPFDLSHVVIRRYNHLGEQGIAFREAKRLIAELKAAIETIMARPKTDSPVYTYLPRLQPPRLEIAPVAESPVSAPPKPASFIPAKGPSEVSILVGEENPSAKAMLDMAQKRIGDGDFSAACVLLEEVRKLRPTDSFVVQQLALATYKSKQPDKRTSLLAAKKILQELSPQSSNNPETLGLWGSIHKRLWEEVGDRQYLDESISAYERGFYLKQDHYNGINVAYLLDVRALENLKIGQRDDAVADHVSARRARQNIIRFVEGTFDTFQDPTSKYWVVATLYEAAIGLEDAEAIGKWEMAAQALPIPEWMQASRVEQAQKLETLLTDYRRLTNGGGTAS